MQKKIKEIISRIFEAPVEAITDDASPDTIENWDSLRHMNLILALEEEFGVQFTDEQIVTMLNVQLIVSNLKEAIN